VQVVFSFLANMVGIYFEYPAQASMHVSKSAVKSDRIGEWIVSLLQNRVNSMPPSTGAKLVGIYIGRVGMKLLQENEV